VRLNTEALAPLGVPTVVVLNRFDAGSDLHQRNLEWSRTGSATVVTFRGMENCSTSSRLTFLLFVFAAYAPLCRAARPFLRRGNRTSTYNTKAPTGLGAASPAPVPNFGGDESRGAVRSHRPAFGAISALHGEQLAISRVRPAESCG